MLVVSSFIFAVSSDFGKMYIVLPVTQYVICFGFWILSVRDAVKFSLKFVKQFRLTLGILSSVGVFHFWDILRTSFNSCFYCFSFHFFSFFKLIQSTSALYYFSLFTIFFQNISISLDLGGSFTSSKYLPIYL